MQAINTKIHDISNVLSEKIITLQQLHQEAVPEESTAINLEKILADVYEKINKKHSDKLIMVNQLKRSYQ